MLMTDNEKFQTLLARVGDDWIDLAEQLIVSRMDGAAQRISDYREMHPDIWPTMIEKLAVIDQANLSDAERTKCSLAYLQTLPNMDHALALDYLRYEATMGLAFAIVQKFAANQIVGGFDEIERRACQNALQAAVHGFDGVGEAQAKLIARSFMRQAQQCIQNAAVELGYAETSIGRASV